MFRRTRSTLALAALLAAATNLHCDEDDRSRPIEPPNTSDVELVTLDVGSWHIGVPELGTFAYDPVTTLGAAEFPVGSGFHTLAGVGLWLSAEVGGEMRATITQRASEYRLGRLGIDPDPFAGRIFKVTAGDDPDATDVVEWPADAGAPVDALGNPSTYGGQVIWSVYNDLDPEHHRLLFSQGLGAEIRQTLRGFDDDQPLDRTVVAHFEVTNRSADAWNDLWIGLWADGQLGGPFDDLCGSDSTRGIGYVYNSSSDDRDYSMPPAAGISILSIRDGDVTLPRTLFFNTWRNGEDPRTVSEVRHLLTGHAADGTRRNHRFRYPGNPSRPGDDDVDQSPGDQRLLMSTGPYDVPPGSTLELTTLLLVSRSGGSEPRLASVTGLLAEFDQAVTRLFQKGVLSAMPPRL